MSTTDTDAANAALDACTAWADRYADMWDMAESFHESLNLTEAEALADVLAAAGRGDLAATLMRGWGIGDPEIVEELNEEANDPHYVARLVYGYGDPIDEYAGGLTWLPPRAEVEGL